MRSDSGIIYCEPPKPLWVPRHHATKPTNLAVRYKTEICDVNSQGRITRVRPGQEGWNEITDWGMDALAIAGQDTLTSYLHLSDTLGTAKRVLSGGITLTLVITNASSIAVTASSGFFLVGDVGNTLSITDLGGAGQTQELKITAFTDSQHVTCSTRAGAWLPGFVAGTGPFAAAGVHFTSTSTLANQFNKYNTFDTSATNYYAELNDSGNSRFIHQRIFLSAAAGSNWTINQLGWSDGNGGNNCFGKVNLASPDAVGTGQKYRVTLQLYSAYTPINIVSQSVNWGATIGTYDLFIRQEVMPSDSGGLMNFIRPNFSATYSRWTGWFTGAFTMAATKWEGDAGYTANPNGLAPNYSGTGDISDAVYTAGSHMTTRTWKMSDAINIAAATGIITYATTNIVTRIAIKPNSGTITKPSGYWAALAFGIFWTRAFSN